MNNEYRDKAVGMFKAMIEMACKTEKDSVYFVIDYFHDFLDLFYKDMKNGPVTEGEVLFISERWGRKMLSIAMDARGEFIEELKAKELGVHASLLKIVKEYVNYTNGIEVESFLRDLHHYHLTVYQKYPSNIFINSLSAGCEEVSEYIKNEKESDNATN